MDENEAQQNNSGGETELSKSIDESSFIGKMKFGVSKILPNSLSKWLSPKVEGNNGRRRRHEEIESDESDISRGITLSTAQQTSVIGQNDNHSALDPPSKRQRTIPNPFSKQNNFDSYSLAIPSRSGRNSIVSSTLIEDAIPQRHNSQLNRISPSNNGQHELVRDDNELDEGSSSLSHDKSANPFTLNNDSSVVNFSAHLQRAKSLFTNRSYVNQKLKNYRMRNPRSALYRSTSSLCDNNSISSNASSAMSSPFYNGETKFGGASAKSRRLNSTFQNDAQQQMYHRPKMPTNLVASRSTSSLNTINSSASMSNTTRRILDVMSKYSTPLTEVRRISNALPSISETSVLSKRKSLLEPDSNFSANEIDRTKRALLKPNTPYNRPYGRNPVDSILTTELHVPSMPELLQLKKFATSTIEIREIANNSKSALNKPVSNPATDSKQSEGCKQKAVNSRETDLDISNNNEKVVNKNSDMKKEHKNKIRTSFMKRKMGKNDEHDSMPEPVNLPNVTLQMDKKIEIKFPEPFISKSQPGATDTVSTIPLKSKASNATGTSELNVNAFQFKSTPEKQMNGNGPQAAKKLECVPTVPSISMKATIPSSCSTTLNSGLCISSQPTKSSWNLAANSSFIFTEPIVVAQSTNSIARSVHNNEYKFSEPLFVESGKEKKSKVETTGALSTFKFDSKPVNKITSDSGIADTTQSFGSIANKSTGLIGNSSTFPSSKGLGNADFAKIISNAPTQPSPCDTFKTISAQQNKDKWVCQTCCVSNEASASKCVCCQTENKKALTSATKSDILTTKSSVDEGFKSLVAQQTQGKWECDACLSRNDKSLNKCLSCEAPNPNASSETNKNANEPQKSFSFGNFSAKPSLKSSDSSIDDTFKSIVEKQKSSKWECSVCATQNDLSVSKCVCCNESKVSETSNSKEGVPPAKPTSQFSFGNMGALNKTNSTGFSFGSKVETAVDNTQSASFGNAAVKTTSSMGQFSFGNITKTSETASFPATKTNETVRSANSDQLFGGTSAATADKGKTLQASDNDLFKKIVAEQSSKWECTGCMIKNEASAKKCVACELPKSGSSVENSSQNVTESLPKPTFSFGLPIANSKTFSFGSEPDKKEETPAAQTSIFGSASLNKPSVTFQFGSSKSTTSTSSVPFAINSVNSAFSSTVNKSASEEIVTNTKDTEKKTAGGFSFSFGAAESKAVKTDTSSSESCSKDVTDLGSQIVPKSVTNVTVTENVLLQPPAKGPILDAPKCTFSLGQNVNQTVQETTEVKQFGNIVPGDKPNFTFGKSESLIKNPFGGAVTLDTSKTSAGPFAFNSNTTPVAFSAPQPTFSAPNFSFGTNSTIPTATPATPATPVTNQPVFGSNSFASPTLPTLNTFNTNNTFGASPAFNPTSQLTSSNQSSQENPPVQPAAGLFQFGASSGSISSPFSSEPPKLGGFNFAPNSSPSFNFSQQVAAPIANQPNVPFQFGATSDAPQNIFSVQSSSTSSTSAIQQRRKLRPVRRVNRQ